ncbi:uncharacterized protein LOC144419946 [Styela clava]
MMALAAISGLLRSGFDFFWVLKRFKDFSCQFSSKFKIAAYALFLLIVYLILWLRQRIFYQHPQLKHLSSRTIKILSWTMSIVLVIGVFFTGVLYLVTAIYIGTPIGCQVVKNSWTSIRYYVLIIVTVFFQVCLLGLYSYPLIQHKRTSRSISQKKNLVIPLIRRAEIAAGCCVATDVAIALIFLRPIWNGQVVTLSTLLYDVNNIVNLIAAIFAFPNWRNRLMPWKIGEEEKARLAGNESSTQNQGTSETNISSVVRETCFVALNNSLPLGSTI